LATHALAVAVVEGLELDNVGVADDSHDLQLSVLGRVSQLAGVAEWGSACLEALVLQDALDGGVFAAGRQLGLEDDAKGAISDDFALSVGEISGLSCDAILHLFPDDLWRRVSSGKVERTERERTYRPSSGC
jgi:hypothetical protein